MSFLTPTMPAAPALIPPPPPPQMTPSTPAADAGLMKKGEAAALAGGTAVTGSQGLTTKANTATKSLLGQ